MTISLFSRAISRPLIKLNSITNQIGKGNLNVLADYESEDEIGELGKTINDMTKNLKIYQEKILESEKKKGTELQGEVNNKTQELRKHIRDNLYNFLSWTENFTTDRLENDHNVKKALSKNKYLTRTINKIIFHKVYCILF